MPFIPDKIQANQGGFIPDDSPENKAIVESHSLLARFGKQIANLAPETAKEAFYGVGGGKIMSWPMAFMLSKKAKERGINLSVRNAHKMIKQGVLTKLGEKIPEFDISTPETTGEKAVDIAAGITKFGIELAVLKKLVPGASDKAIWEMQNLLSGGLPGEGALMHSVFAVPGKVIPGKSITAKGGRIALESGLLGGTSAINQKLTTGEIDWKEVAISAGIPPALHSLGYIKSRIAKGDPKVLEAIKKVEEIKVEPTTKSENINTAIDKMQKYAKKAEKLNKVERKLAVRQLHKEQFAGGTRAKEQARKEGVSPSERLRRISRGFGGKAKIPELKPPELSEAEWDSISLKAEEVYGKDVFKLKEIQTNLDNLKNLGKIPGDRGLGLLEPVLGTETIYKLHETALKQREFSPWDIPDIVVSGFKAPFGLDPQTIRQLAPIATRNPITYLQSIWVNLRSYKNKEYAKAMTEALESDPMWEFSKKKMKLNILGLKPWKVSQKGQTRLQQFGDFTEWLRRRNNRVLKTWGNILAASERGANLGIDYGMLKLAKQKGKQLEKILSKRTLTQAQIDKFWLDAGKDINAFTKRVVAKHPSARKIQKSANYILFSPAYTASYPYRTWRTLYSLFKGSPGNRTTGIQYVLSQIAALTALSSIPAYVAHKYRANDPSKEPPVDSSVNPMESLWGHFRVGNNVYDFTFGEGSYYRLLARIGVSAYLNGRDLITGKQTTRIGGRPVPKAGEELKRYLTSRETVALGLLKTLATGKDWMGEPIDTTWIVNQMMPISALKDLVDAGHANGLWEAMINGDIGPATKAFLEDIPSAMSGAFGAGVTSYKTSPSVTRANFRNITAQRVYNTSWDNLSKGQQARLRFQNRNTFKALDRAVKEYRVQHPYNVERIQEEERNAGKRVSKLLAPQNRKLVKGVSLALNRSPQNLYLNDERYNRYQELVAQILNEKLPKVLEVKDLNRRQKRVELLLSMAKKRAFFMLRREQP